MHEQFWGHAVDTACYIHNRLYCASNPGGKTPYEMVHKIKPNVDHMKVFGCRAEVFVEKSLRNKSFGAGSDHSKTGIFLGYCKKSRGGVFYIPELKRIVSRRLKDSDFDQSHLPLVVGETSLANNSDPNIPKLVATPLESKFDPYAQCATLPNKRIVGATVGATLLKPLLKIRMLGIKRMLRLRKLNPILIQVKLSTSSIRIAWI